MVKSVPLPLSLSSRRKITCWNYIDLLVRNSNYRWYFSHSLQNLGDWFVRIASVLVVQQLFPEETTGSSLAYLILSYMIPKTVFGQVGGVLSDRMDRRSFNDVPGSSLGCRRLGVSRRGSSTISGVAVLDHVVEIRLGEHLLSHHVGFGASLGGGGLE
jgi:hypothetical protein